LDESRRHVKDKHSSLLQKIVNYGRKKFFNIGSRLEVTNTKLFSPFVNYSHKRFERIAPGYKPNPKIFIVRSTLFTEVKKLNLIPQKEKFKQTFLNVYQLTDLA
jgi:hypothetical protein